MRLGLGGTDLAAFGSVSSCWHYNAGNHFAIENVWWKCLCGLLRPSRAHLLWTCAETSHLRFGLQLPQNRCEERPLERGVPEQPPAPPTLDPCGFFDDLVEELKAQLQQDPAVLFLASNGSEHHSVGSFAVCVQPGTYRGATGKGDEDQKAYKQELLGFELAARALHEAEAATRWTARLIFVFDCQSALQAQLLA
ncbi:unnamed protein product [Symbiodinium sp. CCMP2592]|nr:unnamed protein product [Symbiodinium sp. CCMP2592]